MDAEDWDLQAVVRSCCSRSTTTSGGGNGNSSISITPLQSMAKDENEMCELGSFPDLRNEASEELEELYRPFLPEFQLPVVPLSSLLSSSPVVSQIKHEREQEHEHQLLLVHHHHQQQQQQQQLQQQQQSRRSGASIRPKRRKNQQKKVVCQVPAEGLSSDMWAWRKYGQKPIKGSPYPRGYYRCSSSKGCLARKQVERSRTDPGMFIITYTAEHNHPVPTHRNSLAGSTRHKLSSSQTPSGSPSTTTTKPTLSSSPLGLSPITPLTMEEDDEEERLSKGDGEGGEGDVENESLDIGMSNISKLQEFMGEDLFMELDEFLGPVSSAPPPSSFDDSFASHWFSPAAASATAAGGV